MTLYPDDLNETMLATLIQAQKQINDLMTQLLAKSEEADQLREKLKAIESAQGGASESQKDGKESKARKTARPKRGRGKGKAEPDPPGSTQAQESYW